MDMYHGGGQLHVTMDIYIFELLNFLHEGLCGKLKLRNMRVNSTAGT